jgi:2-polyprenyl-3-methyl-5-hydroxy-6-metoxy-1,4-benzoquinol methylase
MFAHDVVYAVSQPDEETLPLGSTLGKILAHVRAGQRVLDVGCGGGRLSKHMAARGAEVVGIERHAEAAASARQHCRLVVEKDLDEPDLLDPAQRFDVIVLADVLEHLVRPDVLLGRLRPHLNPGGFALVSVPNIAYYKIRLRLLRGRFDYEPSGIMDRSHLRFFTRDTAAQLVRDGGFEPAEIDAVYKVPFGRLDRYWQGLHRTIGPLAPEMLAVQWVIKADPV